MNYAAITDWVSYIRHCLEVPAAHPELGGDTLNVDAGLSKVGGELDGTAHAAAFADAALQIMEQGSPDEARQLLQVTLRAAPRAAARVAALARTWRGGPLDDRVGVLLLRGLEADARDPQLLDALAEYAQRGPERAVEVLHDALPHNIDWVASRISTVSAAVDPDGKQLRFLALRTQPGDLPRLVDGIAAAGPDYVARFTSALRAADAPAHLVARIKPALAAHPAFAGSLP